MNMEELNKKTLIEALSSLKEHEPPVSVWEKIDLEMEFGLSEIVPKHNLLELPLHNPPVSVWENISLDLESVQSASNSAKFLRRLTEYDPPESVWANISKALDQGQGAKIVPMTWRKPLSVAASLAVLISAYWFLGNKTETGFQPNVTLNYTTELVDDLLLTKDWNEDDADFERFHELCSVKKYICQHPEFQMLQQEFEELSGAVQELEEAVGAYGTDPSLIGQIKEIELERTTVFKKMMVMLI